MEVVEVSFTDLYDYVDRTFRHIAEAQRLDFLVNLDGGLPAEIRTDVKRLQQVLKNL
jgi:signal transduction histidine kinase